VPLLQRLEHLDEARIERGTASRFESPGAPAKVEFLASVPVESSPRFATGLAEFDRVLGGGLVPGLRRLDRR
jgi:DNA repair protein RadA/Sms